MKKLSNLYDYIVIGAGAAGSIVAAKLAARNASVLLLEAGEQATDPRVWDPQDWYEVLVEDADIAWGFQSVPQEGLYCPTTDNATQPRDDGSDSVRLVAPLPHPLNRGAGTARVLALPQAKVVGGCSLHNAMVYVRGARSDYDRWAALGLTGWDWGHVLPYFEEVEGVVSVLQGERKEPFQNNFYNRV
jgi:choline dehydrogenase